MNQDSNLVRLSQSWQPYFCAKKDAGDLPTSLGFICFLFDDYDLTFYKGMNLQNTEQ